MDEHDAVSRCGSLSTRLTAAKIWTRLTSLGNQGTDVLLLTTVKGNIAQL